MRRIPCVLSVLLLLSSMLSTPAASQDRGIPGARGQQESGFQLEQNYPNPFNPETRIPFVLQEDLFAEGRPVVVTVRILNLLQQFVSTPTALNHPLGDAPVAQLEYTLPGRHEAYWDGRDQAGNKVASGVYFIQLTVNGRSQVRKMFVTK